MRWKMAGGVILAALVVVGAALVLSRYQADRAERIRRERTVELEEAYRDNDLERVVELAGVIRQDDGDEPGMERVLYLEASALRALGREGEREAWMRLLERFPESAYSDEALLALARDAEARSAPAEAREYVDTLLAKTSAGPEASEARLILARLSEESGSDAAARQAYRQVLESGGNTAAGSEAKERLSELNRPLVFGGGRNEFNDVYTVNLGDKLITIANEFDTTVDLLETLNPDAGVLREGQVLTVPRKGGVRFVIDRKALQLSVYSEREGTKGRFMLVYPIGLPEGNERKTPGEYLVGTGKQVFPAKDGGVYGSLGSRYIELVLADTGQGNRVAIHGTDDPASIGRVSDTNSIRMKNADVEEVYALARVGTPVTVE